MWRLLIVLLLQGTGTLQAFAQDAPYLPYYSKDTARVYALAVAQRNAVTTHFVLPRTGSSDYRDGYRQAVQEMAADVYNSIRYSALLDPVLAPYVQQVFARILAANPQLPATTLVLTRNPEPNAHAAGNGTVMLNIGLLPRLENESQLAFILCHELAHVAGQHLKTGLQARLTAWHSKDLKREFRRIVNSEYNISSQVKALALGVSLGRSYHSRRFERQADSLGYVLLARTSYDAAQAYRALQLLDAIDAPEAEGLVELPKYFACTEFPETFGAAPAKPLSIFTVQAAGQTGPATTDTLKSHPDCAKRMRFIKALAKGRVAEGPQPAGPPGFARVRDISRLEVIQSWFDYDCYDHALFDALRLLPRQPRNAYLHSVVLLSLFELRQHLQAHTYTEVVSNISEQNPSNFNDLLYGLYSLHYEDFTGLSACFAQTAGLAAPASGDEYALAARYAASALAVETPPGGAALLEELKEQYQKQYAGGKFNRLLFPPPAAKTKASRR